ncbi:MAG TPA: uroporphyrinogen decarboxylase family protein [Syntrophorhabdaceae bacterium]|nr:uroporphyrinogen decarboxylase family protein [Syntrophorhabdaceae bacterium]
MAKKKHVVEKALSFSGPLPYVPKGELFIERSFLNETFPCSCSYLDKLRDALSILELDMVGIPFSDKEIIKKRNLKKLEDVFLVCNFEGPFSFWMGRLGFIEVLKALRKDRRIIFELTEKFLRGFRKRLPIYKDLGFSGIAIVDDIAGNDGVFFSKNDFEILLKPVYSELVEDVKAHGLFIFFHSDGNLEGYIDEFVNMGFDCLHTLDAGAGMDVYKIMASIKKRVCFMGHIDLLKWDEETVEREIKRAKEIFLDGGMIIGSISGLFGSLLKEKILVLYPGLKERIKGRTI